MRVPQLKAPVALEDHLQGSRPAKVQLVLYGDYDVPGYRPVVGSIHALQYACGGELTFVFRHFPLGEIHAHAHARAASAGAEAAAAQGEFWAMHEDLFEHQHPWRTPTCASTRGTSCSIPIDSSGSNGASDSRADRPRSGERRTQQRGGHRYVLRERVCHASLRAAVPAHRLS